MGERGPSGEQDARGDQREQDKQASRWISAGEQMERDFWSHQREEAEKSPERE